MRTPGRGFGRLLFLSAVMFALHPTLYRETTNRDLSLEGAGARLEPT
jgi:hypothetical protein